MVESTWEKVLARAERLVRPTVHEVNFPAYSHYQAVSLRQAAQPAIDREVQAAAAAQGARSRYAVAVMADATAFAPALYSFRWWVTKGLDTGFSLSVRPDPANATHMTIVGRLVSPMAHVAGFAMGAAALIPWLFFLPFLWSIPLGDAMGSQGFMLLFLGLPAAGFFAVYFGSKWHLYWRLAVLLGVLMGLAFVVVWPYMLGHFLGWIQVSRAKNTSAKGEQVSALRELVQRAGRAIMDQATFSMAPASAPAPPLGVQYGAPPPASPHYGGAPLPPPGYAPARGYATPAHYAPPPPPPPAAPISPSPAPPMVCATCGAQGKAGVAYCLSCGEFFPR